MDLDTKIVILSALVQKVMVKDIVFHNGGQRNAFEYITRLNPSRYFFHLLKGPDPSYLVLKFNILPINNCCGPKCDFAKVMTLKGQGHRSKQMVLKGFTHDTLC